jgi:AraC-like DNA-binding protein
MVLVIFIGSIFSSFITAYLLLFRKLSYQFFSDKLFAFLLLSYSICSIVYLLVTTGFLIQVPFLYRSFAPVNYLIPPLAYFYVRSVLKNESSFKAIDLFHLIPFILMAINYLPFYSLPLEDKKKIVLLVTANTNDNLIQVGYLPEYIQIIRPLQCLVYLIFQWKILLDFKKQPIVSIFDNHYQKVMRWLTIFNWVITAIVISFLLYVVMYSIGIDNEGWLVEVLKSVSAILVAISLFILSSYFLIDPNVLFGLPFVNPKSKVKSHSNSEAKIINTTIKQDFDTDAKLILEYFDQKKPFLRPDLNISSLSVELDIPTRELSFILNHYFKEKFTDFVNSYRIQYVLDEINKGKLMTQTQISIAEEAGFSGKQSFYNAFRKSYHCTPTEFLKKQTA